MELNFKRVDNIGIVTTKEINGKTYYNLADILEAIKVKEKGLLGAEKNIPIQISGEIIWGYRNIGMNLIESIFIDQDGMDKLLILVKAETMTTA